MQNGAPANEGTGGSMLPKRVDVQGIGRSTRHASWVQKTDERRVLWLALSFFFGFFEKFAEFRNRRHAW